MGSLGKLEFLKLEHTWNTFHSLTLPLSSCSVDLGSRSWPCPSDGTSLCVLGPLGLALLYVSYIFT